MNEQQLAESQRGQKNSKDDEPMDPPQITIKPEVETRFEQLSIERKIKKNDDEIHRSDKIQEEQRLSGEVDLAQEQEQESDYAMHGGTANNTGEHAQVHPEHTHAPCPQSNYPSRCRERHRTGSEHAINCVVLQSPFASPFTVPLSIATSTGMAAVMNGRNGRIPYTTIFAGVSFKLFSSYAMVITFNLWRSAISVRAFE